MFIKNILVVDDDEVILSLISFILSEQGYYVTKLNDSREALYMLMNKNNIFAPIDLLVTDLEMPNLSGFLLIDTLRKNDISVPTIVMSGNPQDVITMESQSLDCVGYLQKPFRVLDLISLVNNTLVSEKVLKLSG